MSKKDEHGYPVEPRKTDNDHFWFYVQKEGIIIAHGNGTATIRWAQIERAISDHKAAQR